MRTIIAGSRTVEDYAILLDAIRQCPWKITSVISGHARTGVDVLGERWAAEKGLKCVIVPAKWVIHGKRAGPLRNAEMVQQADALIMIGNGVSPETIDVIKKAGDARLWVMVVNLSNGLTIIDDPIKTWQSFSWPI